MEEHQSNDPEPELQLNLRRMSTGSIPPPYPERTSLLNRAFRNLSKDGAESVEGDEPLTQHEKNEILRAKWIQRSVELERLRKEIAKLEAKLDKNRDFWKDKHYVWQREFDALQDRNVELEDRNYEMWCALAEKDQDAKAQKKNVDTLTARIGELERENRDLQKRLDACLEREAEFNTFFFGYIMQNKDDPSNDRFRDDGDNDFMSLDTSSSDISMVDPDAPLHNVAQPQDAPVKPTQGIPLPVELTSATEVQVQEVLATEAPRKPSRPVEAPLHEPQRLDSISRPIQAPLHDLQRLDSISRPAQVPPPGALRLDSIVPGSDVPDLSKRATLANLREGIANLSKQTTLATLGDAGVNLLKQTTFSNLGEGVQDRGEEQ